MPKPSDGDIRDATPNSSEWMRKALHDLCQPLTALDCLLCLNSMPGLNTSDDPDSAALQRTIGDAMVQCSRMMEVVRSMQSRISLDEHGMRVRDAGGLEELC